MVTQLEDLKQLQLAAVAPHIHHALKPLEVSIIG